MGNILSTQDPFVHDVHLPKIDPYTAFQLIAATMVVVIPTILAFVLGVLMGGLGTGLVWAAVIGFVAGSVIATSTLVAYVGVLPAFLGISGIWGLTLFTLLWVLPECPTVLGYTCGSDRYAAVMAVGMLAPWAALTIVAPFVYTLRKVSSLFNKYRSKRRFFLK